MGSLGPPARAMAVRSAFALFCFALLCGLAASSIQTETETDLTKEGEATGDEVLVEQAVESRAARGADKKTIKMLREKCRKRKGKGNACKRLAEKRRDRKNSTKARKEKKQKAKRKGKKASKKNGGAKKKGRNAKKNNGRKRKNLNKNKKKNKKQKAKRKGKK